MLNRYIFIIHFFCDQTGFGYCFCSLARKHNFASAYFWETVERTIKNLLEQIDVYIQFLQEERGHVFINFKKRLKNMLVLNLLMTIALSKLLCLLNGLL